MSEYDLHDQAKGAFKADEVDESWALELLEELEKEELRDIIYVNETSHSEFASPSAIQKQIELCAARRQQQAISSREEPLSTLRKIQHFFLGRLRKR